MGNCFLRLGVSAAVTAAAAAAAAAAVAPCRVILPCRAWQQRYVYRGTSLEGGSGEGGKHSKRKLIALLWQ